MGTFEVGLLGWERGEEEGKELERRREVAIGDG